MTKYFYVVVMMNTEFNKRTIRIGSGPDCDIHIEGPFIADIHAYMYVDDDKICLELLPDCSAMLNGNEVEGRYWLQESDKVVIGGTMLDLCTILQWLEGHEVDYDDGYAFINRNLLKDYSDAVAIKHNWWPAIIVTLIILAVSAFVGFRFVKYHSMREKQMEELRLIQDSLMQSRIKIDSLNESLKNIEQE